MRHQLILMATVTAALGVLPAAAHQRDPSKATNCPELARQARMEAYQAQHQAAGPDVAPGLLQYGGGSSGFGVVTMWLPPSRIKASIASTASS